MFSVCSICHTMFSWFIAKRCIWNLSVWTRLRSALYDTCSFNNTFTLFSYSTCRFNRAFSFMDAILDSSTGYTSHIEKCANASRMPLMLMCPCKSFSPLPLKGRKTCLLSTLVRLPRFFVSTARSSGANTNHAKTLLDKFREERTSTQNANVKYYLAIPETYLAHYALKYILNNFVC